MVLTKEQIKSLEKVLKKADKLQMQAQFAAEELSSLIEEFTGVENYVDYMQGDGHGITPASNNDTHMPILFLINAAKRGVDISEEYILDNLSI